MTTRNFSRVLSVIVIALVLGAFLAVSAFAALEIVDGKLTGGDDGVTYTAYKVNGINAAGTALDVAADATAINGSENLTAGLWKVVGTNETDVIVHSASATVDTIINTWPAGTTIDASKGYVNDGAAESTKLSYTIPESKGVILKLTNNVTNVFNVGYWTGYHKRATRYQYQTNAMAISSASGTVTDFATLNAVETTYAYEPGEIIPMSQFESLKFKAATPSYGITVSNGSLSTRVIFYVATENGAIVQREVTKTHLSNGTWNKYESRAKDVTVTLSDFTDKTGYIVGIQIYPIVATEGSTITTDSARATNPTVIFAEDSYKIAPPRLAKPNLTVNGTTVSGLREELSYDYYEVNVNGVAATATGTIAAGNTTVTLPAGLWSVVAKGDGVTSGDSLPAIVYVKGNKTGTIYRTKSATNSGGAAITVIPVADGSVTDAPVFIEGVWRGYTVSTVRLTEYYGVTHQISTSDKVVADIAAANLNKIRITYQYTADEIIPLSKFDSFTFTVGDRQGDNVSASSLLTKLEFYVVTETGAIETRTATLPYTRNAVQTFTGDMFADKSGYIVGLAIYPYTAPAGETPTVSADIAPSVTVQVGGGYRIILPKADKPVVEVDGTTVSGLSADLTYKYYAINANGTAATATGTVSGTTSATLPAGLWSLVVAGDGVNTNDSDPTVVYIKGNSTANILHTTAANYLVLQNGTDALEFKEGYWTGYNGGATTYNNGSYFAAGIYRIGDNSQRYTPANVNTMEVTYGYTPDEIIPFNDFRSFKFTVNSLSKITRTGGTAGTKFLFYVSDLNGNITTREAFFPINDSYTAYKVYTWTVTRDMFTDLTGYIVGIQIYPYVYSADATVTFDANIGPNVEVYSDGYITADTPVPAPSVPTLAVSYNGVVSVSDYNPLYTYYWSIGGESWTEFTGGSFQATKAGTEYSVKASNGEVDSEVATATTRNILFINAELLWGGSKLAIRFNFDIKDNTAGAITSISTVTGTGTLVTVTDGKFSDHQTGWQYGVPSKTSSRHMLYNSQTGYYTSTYYINPEEFDTIQYKISSTKGNSSESYYDLGITGKVSALDLPVPAAPELTIDGYSKITVTNYSAALTYEYKVGDGAWTEFTGATLQTGKAGQTYQIRAKYATIVSEAAEILSNDIIYRGASLLLDGQIGIKVYVDLADERIDSIGVAPRYYATLAGGAKGTSGWTDRDKTWTGKFLYDADKDLYYATYYVNPKDYATASVTVSNFTSKNQPSPGVNVGVAYSGSYTIKVSTLIDTYQADPTTYAAVLPLVNALEVYCENAAYYFAADKTDLTAPEAIDVTVPAAPEKAVTGTLADGVTFYGTSLMLEEGTTIRYYFRVAEGADLTGIPAGFGEKDGVIYYDGNQIAAHQLGAANVKTIGDVTVTYTAHNYMADEQSNEKVGNLVKALYNYYQAAVEYKD